MRDFFRALDAKTYPATVAAAFELTSVPPSEEFRFGLQLVLDESSGVAGQEHVKEASGERDGRRVDGIGRKSCGWYEWWRS